MARDIKNRRSRRLPFRKRIRYGQRKPEYTGHTLNLSLHGTVIETARVFPRGTTLLIEIMDNTNNDGVPTDPLILNGVVVWAQRSLGLTHRGKMGIEFKNYQRMEAIYQSRNKF